MLKDVFDGVGEATKLDSQEKALKLFEKLATDKDATIREATGLCYGALAAAGGAALFSTMAFDAALNTCLKSLEDESPAVRNAFSEALGKWLSFDCLTPQVVICAPSNLTSVIVRDDCSPCPCEEGCCQQAC